MNKFEKIMIISTLFIFVLYIFISDHIYKKDSNNKFEEATKEKIEEFDVTNDVTKVNKYSVKKVDHEEIAKLYYNDYKNMIVNYPDEAYELVINNEDISKTKFLNYRDQLIEDYYNYNYVSYSYYQESTSNSFVYRVTNSKDEVFTFKTYSVMNYDVNITI